MKKLIPVVLVFLLLLSGCSSLFWAAVVGSAISDTPDPSDDTSVPANTPKQTDAPKPTAKPTPEPPKALTYGDTFEFDGFEITFLPEYDFTTIDNKFSDLDGHDVIIYSLSLTNKSGSTKSLNMFYYKAFLPDGTQAGECSAFFMEDDITWAGEMRDGATLNSKMHVPYSEDGTYYVKFDKFATEIEVELPVTKPAA